MMMESLLMIHDYILIKANLPLEQVMLLEPSGTLLILGNIQLLLEEIQLLVVDPRLH